MKLLFAILALAGQISLGGKWTLDYWEQGREPVRSPEAFAVTPHRTVTATVPGNVELDLLSAGLVKEPEKGSNVYLLRPFEGYQWRYSRTFPTPAHGPEDVLLLDFEGIDCFSDIYLNGKCIGSTDNMLIAHRFDVSSLLAPEGEENTLEVYLRSTVMEVREKQPPVFSYNWGRTEAPWVRRAAHTFGWDIMPRLVSAGLWRDVILEVKSPVHIKDVHWTVTATDPAARTASLMLDYALELPVRYQEDQVYAELSVTRDNIFVWKESFPVRTHAARLRAKLEDVDLWWPRGYGESALYDAEFALFDGKGHLLDSDRRRIGLRTVRLERSEVHTSEAPGAFQFYVNGEPVFIKGSNWVPLDAFHSRDPQHLEAAFELVKQLNCNMLRCWGGNVYEDHAFYDLCDENGVMVWQDFAMGCTAYPQTLAFRQVIEKEIYQIVTKLRNHPCIALWAGNNEDDVLVAKGDFKAFKPDPNADEVSRRIIPAALYDLDPTRPYLPSSPYWSPDLIRDYYSDAAAPEDHLWGPRGYYKDPFYSASNPLFASEIGYHGMPCRSSLEKMFDPEDVYPWTGDFVWKDAWKTKAVRKFKEDDDRDANRNNLMTKQVKILFGDVPTDLDAFIFASQSVQAEAMKYFVELFRGHKDDGRTGILWWNVRDGWPIISDAVVDWYNTPKAAFYYLCNVQRNTLVLMLDARQGKHPLVAVNDTREAVRGSVRVTNASDGALVWEGKYDLPANGRAVIANLPVRPGQGMYLIDYEDESCYIRRNHYLWGEPPFRLEDYRGWIQKTGLFKH